MAKSKARAKTTAAANAKKPKAKAKPAPRKPGKTIAAKKSAPKKAAAKKPAPKKAVAKKLAPKKAVAKKPAPKKAVAKKPAPKKAAAKPVTKKAVAKKSAAMSSVGMDGERTVTQADAETDNATDVDTDIETDAETDAATDAETAPETSAETASETDAEADETDNETDLEAAMDGTPEPLLPTAAEETRFWSMLEDAWAAQGAEVNAARLSLATRDPESEVDTGVLEGVLDAVLANLRAAFTFEDFPREELVAMDRVIERKLYEIDRADVHAVIDGSDDGFLYGRGFVVALGRAYFDAVSATPALAIQDAECEELCYLPAHIHEERFGAYPENGSDISRETCSNSAGWPEQ